MIAKQQYKRPMGYATRTLCSRIPRAVTNILELDSVHQRTVKDPRINPSGPLQGGLIYSKSKQIYGKQIMKLF